VLRPVQIATAKVPAKVPETVTVKVSAEVSAQGLAERDVIFPTRVERA
jgi:hypothetical protein